MKTVVTQYAAIGCDSACVHRPPDVHRHSIEQHATTREGYLLHRIIPKCGRNAEVASRRREIYDRADAKATAAEARYATLRTKMKARRVAWEAVAAEWKEQPCPFYEEPT